MTTRGTWAQIMELIQDQINEERSSLEGTRVNIYQPNDIKDGNAKEVTSFFDDQGLGYIFEPAHGRGSVTKGKTTVAVILF